MAEESTTETPTLTLVYSAPMVRGNGDIVVNKQALVDERAIILARLDLIEKIINRIPRTSELRRMDNIARRKRERSHPS